MANKGAFKKGEKRPKQGRPKGTANKFTRTVKDAVQAAFDSLQTDKKANLEAWGRENPTDFYRIAAKLIPAAVEAKVTGSVTVVIDDKI